MRIRVLKLVVSIFRDNGCNGSRSVFSGASDRGENDTYFRELFLQAVDWLGQPP